MIGVQEDREIEFIAQAPHESADLAHAEKFALAFRYTYDYGNVQALRRSEDGLQNDEIGDIEMADGDPTVLRLFQNLL
jgi:hypothetical protein